MSGPLKIGAEPRKVAALAGLLILAAGIYFWNAHDSNGPTSSVKTAAPPRTALKRALQNPPGAETQGDAATTASPAAAAEAARDFRPTMKRKSDDRGSDGGAAHDRTRASAPAAGSAGEAATAADHSEILRPGAAS